MSCLKGSAVGAHMNVSDSGSIRKEKIKTALEMF